MKTKPRLYQEKILSTTNTGNTLVVLPTGMGKTLIAIMLGLIRQKLGSILFMSPTKPLVEQHAKTIFENTGIMPEILHGKIPFKKRKDLWNSPWIVATPQTVQRDLIRGINLSNFSLIIIDEAHRAVGDYAYTYVAKEYLKAAKNPLILGLTASPGTNMEKISEIITNLAITNVEVRSENDEDVRTYIQRKFVNWIAVTLPSEYKERVGQVKDVLRVYLHSLKKMGYIPSADMSKIRKSQLLRLQPNVVGDFDGMSTLAACIKGFHALEMIETQSMLAYSNYLEKLKTDTTRAGKELSMALPHALNLEHPKMEKLMLMIKKEQKPAIIFANFRNQVDYIVNKLNENGIKTAKFVGQKKGMTQKKQKEIVQDFRDNKFEVIVSTSVGEEGIDIPSVKTIIFYEPVSSAIRHIQRRGRLRRGGKVFILMTKFTHEEGFYFAAKAKEKRMIKILKEFKTFKPKLQTESQSTLHSYESEKKIIVDDREVEIAKLLENKIIKRLKIGDFILSDRLAVERKTAGDFVSSIIDGRLFDQISKLKETYEKPLILIEGFNLFNKRGIHPNAIRGALASLSIDWGIPILFTKNKKETVNMLEVLFKRETKEGRSPSIKVPKATTLQEYQEKLISMLPGINLVLAKRLLTIFGSPSKVFNASIYELMSVEGIGEAKANEIRKTLEKTYGVKDDW